MEGDKQSSSSDSPSARDLYLLGRSCFSQGRYEEARQAFLGAVKGLDGYADIHHYLGVIAHLHADFRAAVGHFRDALTKNPNYMEALINLAITYNTVGLYDSASRYFRLAAEKSSSSASQVPGHIAAILANRHAELGSVYHDHFVYEQAIEQFEQALRLCPTFVDIRCKLAASLRGSGRLEETVREFRTALEYNPDYHGARIQLGHCLLKMDRCAEARAEFETVLRHSKENTQASAGLAMLEHLDRGSSDPPASVE